MKRIEILEVSKNIVCGDREEQYGTPENNFETIAEMWSSYLYRRGVVFKDIDSKDVAAMMIILKLVRIANGKQKCDNWVDIAGYAACGGEIESEGENK